MNNYYTFVQTCRTYDTNSKRHVNHGLWVRTVWQCRLTPCNRRATVAGDVDNRGGYTCVGAGGVWATSVPFVQFFCEPKSVLKNSQLKTTSAPYRSTFL